MQTKSSFLGKKKEYNAPKLRKFGTVKEGTNDSSAGGSRTDHGIGISNYTNS